jgi:hypothetical protein
MLGHWASCSGKPSVISSFIVKIVRIWLLVLLAVLLPIRGAVAAAMACPNESTPMHQHAPSSLDHRTMGHDHLMGVAHHHVHAEGHDEHGGAAHGDKCNLCASCCTVTAMATSFQAVFAPLESASETFSAPASPAVSFVSDGQERPPRSI